MTKRFKANVAQILLLYFMLPIILIFFAQSPEIIWKFISGIKPLENIANFIEGYTTALSGDEINPSIYLTYFQEALSNRAVSFIDEYMLFLSDSGENVVENNRVIINLCSDFTLGLNINLFIYFQHRLEDAGLLFSEAKGKKYCAPILSTFIGTFIACLFIKAGDNKPILFYSIIPLLVVVNLIMRFLFEEKNVKIIRNLFKELYTTILNSICGTLLIAFALTMNSFFGLTVSAGIISIILIIVSDMIFQ